MRCILTWPYNLRLLRRFVTILVTSLERPILLLVLLSASVALLPFSGWLHSTGLFCLGVVMLIAGGDLLVNAAVAIARRIGWSTLVIGLTIVAFGTSAPELALNIYAAWDNNGDLSFGNVVGSNIANIGLVLGFCALVTPLFVTSRVIKSELPLLVLISLMLIVLAWATPDVEFAGKQVDGFGWVDGLILLGLAVGCTALWVQQGRHGEDPLSEEIIEEETERHLVNSMDLSVAIFLLGLGMLIGGGNFTEKGAVAVAGAIGVSDALIGLTIVALATSLPEFFTALSACRKGHADLAVGNIVGSNIFNIALVLGATASLSFFPDIGPVPLPEHGYMDMAIMFLLVVMLIPMAAFYSRHVNRLEGLTLLLCYFGYMAYAVWREVGVG